VGSLIATIAAIVLALQLIVYPPLVHRLGAMFLYRASILITALSCLMLPFVPLWAGGSAQKPTAGVNAGTGAGTNAELRLQTPNPNVVWPLLFILRGIGEFFKQVLFIATFTFVNNSAPLEQRGLVNGLAISVASVFKGLGPTVGGSVFALSLRSHLGYPLNTHAPWVLICVTYMLLLLGSLFLPSSISGPRDIGLMDTEVMDTEVMDTEVMDAGVMETGVVLASKNEHVDSEKSASMDTAWAGRVEEQLVDEKQVGKQILGANKECCDATAHHAHI